MKIVSSVSELPDLSAHKRLVLDTETSGLSVHMGDRICGIVIGPLESTEGWYIPIRHREPAPNLPPEAVFAWLKQYTEDTGRLWVLHNCKFDLGMLRADGIEIRGPIIDTMIMAHVVHGGLYSYELDSLTKLFITGFEHVKHKELIAWFAANQPKTKTDEGDVPKDYSHAPVQLLGEYALEDLVATRNLANKLMTAKMRPARANRGNAAWSQSELLVHEMVLVRVIFEMEWTGIRVDVKRCCELRDKTLDEINNYEDKMTRLVGFPFNAGSWKQMMDALKACNENVLYWMKPERKHAKKYPFLKSWEFRGKQKLDQFTMDYNRSTKRPCWNAMAILKYLERFQANGNARAYWLMRYYHEWDLRSRILNTYVLSYIKQCDYQDRIHGSFNQHGTVTGRLSSNHPNLQNVAKVKGTPDQKTFEKFFGEKDDEAINRQIRGLFIASPGHVFVSIDYSQIEYRVAAYLAQDPILLEKYRNDPKTDYHEVTSELCAIDRDLSKIVNFGTLYGMLANGLAMTLTAMGRQTTKSQAEGILNRIFTVRPALKNLIDEVAKEAEKGWVQNEYGRVCPVPKGKEYVGLNYRDQGLVGDMMREAIVKVAKFLEDKGWHQIKMLVTVHDELLFEMPVELVEACAPEIAKVMVDVKHMDVPVLCDIEVGDTWGTQIALEEWLAGRKENVKNSVAEPCAIG